ncbi:MAG: hypothetical protein LCH41_11575 [Armatimonadetes bacterium]|nr:hypothetical protein [Armatimonadota bacterium]
MQRGFLSQLRRLWIVITILAGLSGMALGVSMQIAASGSECGHERQDCCHQESKQDSCHGTAACVCPVSDFGLGDAPLALPQPLPSIELAILRSEIRFAFGEQDVSGEIARPINDPLAPPDWLVDSAGPRAPPC